MTSQLKVDRISPATGSEIIIDGWEMPEIPEAEKPADSLWRTTKTVGGYYLISRRSWYRMLVTDPGNTEALTHVDKLGGLNYTDNCWTCPSGKGGWYMVGASQRYHDNGQGNTGMNSILRKHGVGESASSGTDIYYSGSPPVSASGVAHVPCAATVLELQDGESVSFYVLNNYNGDSSSAWRILDYDFWGYRLGDSA